MSAIERFAGAALVIGALGCAPPVDPAAIAAVEVTSKIEPPPACRALGPLEGKDTDRWAPGGLSQHAALLDLRKKAAAGGGNHVVIDEVTPPQTSDYMPSFSIQGRLFACPAAAARSATLPPEPASSATPASARVCEPDCSPGYTCLRGVCVSACNPLCPSGERCGADRICRPDAVPVSPGRAPAGI